MEITFPEVISNKNQKAEIKCDKLKESIHELVKPRIAQSFH